jgi:hypothetical protein
MGAGFRHSDAGQSARLIAPERLENRLKRAQLAHFIHIGSGFAPELGAL